MERLSAAQVAKNIELTGLAMEAVGANGVAEIYRDMERFVRQNLCETEDQSRQRFEAWLSIKCDSATLNWPVNFARRADGSYRNEWIESHWQAWQASQTFTEASK